VHRAAGPVHVRLVNTSYPGRPLGTAEMLQLEQIPLDVNQKNYTGFAWARKSDSYAPTAEAGRRW